MLTFGIEPLTESALLAEPATPAPRGRGRLARTLLRADVAWRLGPRACALFAWHRLRLRTGLAARSLGDCDLPPGRLLPDAPPQGTLAGDAAALAAAAEASIGGGWHGAFPAEAPALALDLFASADIRPVWEANRLLALPLLVLAARCAAADRHLERAEALLADWRAANPPFRGPAWACGQEAALRALHLCLALALLEADGNPTPAMRALLVAHARRVAATRAYAAAQDNNHAISEPAGLFVLGLVLKDRRMARRGAHDLVRTVGRLVAPDGSFAQASPGYHRLLLDTLSIAEWFRRRHGAPPFGSPFARRAAAAAAWLARVMEPGTGALPRCGAVDDSHVADLTLHGAGDARGSVERAQTLFGTGRGGALRPPGAPGIWRDGPEGDHPSDVRPRMQPGRQGALAAMGGARSREGQSSSPWAFIRSGSARMGQNPSDITRAEPVAGTARAFEDLLPVAGMEACGIPAGHGTWRSEGWFGADNARFRLLLRTGAPLRFRPSHADLLHLDLALDGMPLLIDGGTGAYNPPPGCAWWTDALAGTAGHNTIQFDGQDQMPRIGRFLFARWPECRALSEGGALRDHRGRTHLRRIRLSSTMVTIEDQVGGPFARLALRWRLAPGAWTLTTAGVSGPRARITVTADAPCRIRLAQGWHSPAYGRVEPAPVLELVAVASVTSLVTRVEAA